MAGIVVTHLRPAELAERWRLKENTLAKWRVSGEGPRFIRFGLRRILYPLTEVEAFEKANMMAAVHLPLED